jgi:hypothetical protein
VRAGPFAPRWLAVADPGVRKGSGRRVDEVFPGRDRHGGCVDPWIHLTIVVFFTRNIFLTETDNILI